MHFRLEVQLSEKHLEADAYNLFEKVMEQVKCWYLPEKEAQSPTVEVSSLNRIALISFYLKKTKIKVQMKNN